MMNMNSVVSGSSGVKRRRRRRRASSSSETTTESESEGSSAGACWGSDTDSDSGPAAKKQCTGETPATASGAAQPVEETLPAAGPAVKPDWDKLLLDAKDPEHIEEILTFSEGSFAEDCKKALEASMDFVGGKVGVPVLSLIPSLRDFNQSGKIPRLLKSIRKAFINPIEECIAVTLMLYYVACCCEEGSLMSLYATCKDSTKTLHLASLCTSLTNLVELNSFGIRRCSSSQLRNVGKLAVRALDRVPKHLPTYRSSVQSTFQRKIYHLEAEEREEASAASVYAFDDCYKVSPASMKNIKSSKSSANKEKKRSGVHATSKHWQEERIGFNSYVSQKQLHTSTSAVKVTVSKKPPSYMSDEWSFQGANDDSDDSSLACPLSSASSSSDNKLHNSFNSRRSSNQNQSSTTSPDSASLTSDEESLTSSFSKYLDSLNLKRKMSASKENTTNGSIKGVSKRITSYDDSSDDSLPELHINGWKSSVGSSQLTSSKTSKCLLPGSTPKIPVTVNDKEKTLLLRKKQLAKDNDIMKLQKTADVLSKTAKAFQSHEMQQHSDYKPTAASGNMPLKPLQPGFVSSLPGCKPSTHQKNKKHGSITNYFKPSPKDKGKALTSPYKSKKNTWSNKYDSPSKESSKTVSISKKPETYWKSSEYRSPLKGLTKVTFQESEMTSNVQSQFANVRKSGCKF